MVMELSKEQYDTCKGSLERYELTVKHKFRVYNDTDFNLLNGLVTTFGLPTSNLKCTSCNGLIKAQEMVRLLKPLFKNYEEKL